MSQYFKVIDSLFNKVEKYSKLTGFIFSMAAGIMSSVTSLKAIL